MRAGVGELVLFEFDPADRTNLGRVLHLRTRDAADCVNKATRTSEVVTESGLSTKVTIIPGGDRRHPEVAAELRGCDLLVGCVDRDWARLILCELSYQYLIPLIDLGTEIQSVSLRSAKPRRPDFFCGAGSTLLALCKSRYSGATASGELPLGGAGASARHGVLRGYPSRCPSRDGS